VRLWAREREVAQAINAQHVNPLFLPDVALDPGIMASESIATALDGAQAVLLAVPAQFLRAVLGDIAASGAMAAPLVICAKGVERGTLKLMSEIAAEALPAWPRAVLSGPTFAGEVARGLPTAVTLAGEDAALTARLVAAIGGRALRPYGSDDPIGAQIGGAVKNVIAIACGIVEGRALGDSARAALMTRGLAEIMRLAVALGGKRETIMGLSGLGDLALTCNSAQSRNMALGIALGEGRTLDQALSGKRSIAEGVASAEAIADLARRLGVDMPIVNAVDAILHHFADIDSTIAGIMARPLRAEERA
jgi:glycerol-3-phosphate dehydrogenase (NAD(P)+)